MLKVAFLHVKYLHLSIWNTFCIKRRGLLYLGDKTFVIECFAGINCTILRFVLPRRVSGLYNLCLRIIQIQMVLSPFLFILIKRVFKTISLRCYVALLRTWRRRCFHGTNVTILMPQIFDVTTNENVRYKLNELECNFSWSIKHKDKVVSLDVFSMPCSNMTCKNRRSYAGILHIINKYNVWLFGLWKRGRRYNFYLNKFFRFIIRRNSMMYPLVL